MLQSNLAAVEFTPKKNILVLWLFAFSYLFLISLVAFVSNRSGESHYPAIFSLQVAISYALNFLLGFLPIPLFLILFVQHSEKSVSAKSAIVSLGLNRSGIKRSLLWSVPFFVLLIVVIEVWTAIAQALLGLNFVTAISGSTKIPQWYAVLTIISAMFNAIMEETLGRGYMLDRLMPAHPTSLAPALPAVLVVSILGTLYHIGPYLFNYQFSLLSAFYNLVVVFLCFTFIGFAYVRSRVRNISGPILMHFLLDALPYVYLLFTW